MGENVHFRLTENIVADVDSLGNELTSEQASYFRNSKVRDYEGNLLVCHHGTDARFDTFEKGDIGFHFGTEKAATNRREFKKDANDWYVDKYYLNITNPFVEEFDYGGWDGITIAAVWMFGTSYDGLAEYIADGTLEGDMYIPHDFSDENSVSIIKDVVKRFADVDDWSATYDYNSEPNRIMRKLFESKGYDGIQYVNTFEDEDGLDYSYIVFHPNQVKAISGKTPTSSGNFNEKIEHITFDEDSFDYDELFAVDSVRELKQFMNSQRCEEFRVVDSSDYDGKYYIGNARSYVHGDILSKAAESGWFPNHNRMSIHSVHSDTDFIYIVKGKNNDVGMFGCDDYCVKYVFDDYTILTRDRSKENKDIIKKFGKLLDLVDLVGPSDNDILDSQGNELTVAQMSFFKNSAIRDGDGRLLVCYHNTDVEFDIFDKERIRTGTFGNGFYFTTNKRSADSYGGKFTNAYYLNAKKVAVIPEKYEDIHEYLIAEFGADDISLLFNAGYDAISTPMYWDDDMFEYYVVFEPNQIKRISNKTPTSSDNLNEDVNDFPSFEKRVYDIAHRIVSQIESKLDRYGFEIDLITDYEDYDVSDDFVGMFMGSIQDNASVFPIVLNAKCMYDYLKKTGDENDLGYITWGVKSTLWHEVGHGIASYLSDMYDFDWDEEEVVEEFAIRMCDMGTFGGELFDALTEYIEYNDSENIDEGLGDSNMNFSSALEADIKRSLNNVYKDRDKYETQEDLEDAMYWAVYDCVRDLQFLSMDKEEVIQDLIQKELNRVGTVNENQSAKTTLRFKIFNEGVKNTRRIHSRQKRSKGSMTDIAKKLGIKIDEDFLTKDTLVESKADQQKFIDKFGKEFFDIFWNNKQRLKNKDINVDILWHVKHTSLSDMRKILDSVSDEARAQEVDIEGAKLPEPTGNYDVVFESDEYIVYNPHDYVSSIYCAKGGRWCTAGGYSIPEGQVKVSQARQYFNQYTGQGVELYYFIKSDGDRYALAVYPNGVDYEVFNKNDVQLDDIEDIPGIDDIEIEGLDLDYMKGNGRRATCENCGERLREEDIFWGPSDESYCEGCFDDLCGWCIACNEIFYEDDLIRGPDDNYYCDYCAREKFVACDWCREYVDIDFVYYTDSGENICGDCMRKEGFHFCDWCGDVITDDDYHEFDEEIYCYNCIDRVASACSECGVVALNRNMVSVNGSEPMCQDCATRDVDESYSRPMKFRLVEDIDAVKKNYPKISDEDFDRVIRLDPTFVEGKDSVGTYGKWLLNLFNKGKLDNEGHVMDCLSRFEEEKKNLKNKDIGQFKSLEDVDAYLNDEENYKNKSHRQEVRDRQKDRKSVDLSKEADVVYKDNFWTVWTPNTYAASCKLGQGSSWCTASTESDHYYNYYTRQGPLFIVLNNADDKEKYQFHFETASFMDIHDDSIGLIAFLREEEGLFDFFRYYLYDYISLSEDDIVDGKITTSIYDKEDFRDIFGNNDYKFIYSIIGADGDDYEYFTGYSTDIDISNLPSFDSMPERILKLLAVLGITSSDELEEELDTGEDIYESFQQAYDLAELSGTVQEARKTIIGAIESADGEYKDQEVYITVTEDELLDNFDDYFYDCQTYEDILKSMFKDKFEFREPYYGWSGFDNDIFYEELEWRLTEVAQERKGAE